MTLTRKEAIDRCGIVAVNYVENVQNVIEEPRLTRVDDECAYVVIYRCWDYENKEYGFLKTVWYQPEHTIRTTEDFDALVWEVDHYEIV